MSLLLLFLGGGLGTVGRYGVGVLVSAIEPGRDIGRFPLATLIVNVIGCAVIGALAPWAMARPGLRLFLMVGVLGGFTTYSSFGLDTVRLIEAGHIGKAALYVVLTTALGLGSAWAAFTLAGGSFIAEGMD